MRKSERQTEPADRKHSSGRSLDRPATSAAGKGSGPFSLPRTADFYQKILRLMADLPKLLTGEKPPRAQGEPRPAPDDCLNAALAETGKLLGVSRVYVMLDEKGGRYLRNTHEWVDGKIGPAMHSWPLHDYEKDIPSLRGLMAEQDFFAGHTRDMPPDMQRVLGMQGVDSVLLAPLVRGGMRIGLLGFDSCGEERVWQEEETIVLRHLASLTGLFLERREYVDARRALAGIRDLLDREERRSAAAYPTAGSDESSAASGRPFSLQEAERRLILETLDRCRGNKSQAARQLGLKWAALDRRCKKLGIDTRRE